MVLLFRKMDLVEQTKDEASQVLVLRPRGKKVSYAFGALWSGQKGGVQTREELKAFLEAEVERRTLSPRIRLKTEASRSARELSPIQISTRLAESEMKRRGDSLSDGGLGRADLAAQQLEPHHRPAMQAMDAPRRRSATPASPTSARRTIRQPPDRRRQDLGMTPGSSASTTPTRAHAATLQARHPYP